MIGLTLENIEQNKNSFYFRGVSLFDCIYTVLQQISTVGKQCTDPKHHSSRRASDDLLRTCPSESLCT